MGSDKFGYIINNVDFHNNMGNRYELECFYSWLSLWSLQETSHWGHQRDHESRYL
jgi:hypothetical protein